MNGCGSSKPSSRSTNNSLRLPRPCNAGGSSGVNCLQQTGRNREAFDLLKQLVADYPHDVGLLQQYVNALTQAGEDETAFRLLREAMAAPIEWLPYEAESLRSSYCQRMQERGRWPEVAAFLAEWLKRDPEMSTPYEEYLGALLRLDKLEEANAKGRTVACRGSDVGKVPAGSGCTAAGGRRVHARQLPRRPPQSHR